MEFWLGLGEMLKADQGHPLHCQPLGDNSDQHLALGVGGDSLSVEWVA